MLMERGGCLDEVLALRRERGGCVGKRCILGRSPQIIAEQIMWRASPPPLWAAEARASLEKARANGDVGTGDPFEVRYSRERVVGNPPILCARDRCTCNTGYPWGSCRRCSCTETSRRREDNWR